MYTRWPAIADSAFNRVVFSGKLNALNLRRVFQQHRGFMHDSYRTSAKLH